LIAFCRPVAEGFMSRNEWSCQAGSAHFHRSTWCSVEKRAAFLEGACGGDERLRRKVEALLTSHEEIGDFLQESPDEAVSQARIAATADESLLIELTLQLLEQIGEGAAALFSWPNRRSRSASVRVKVIKPGMDTKKCYRQVRAERQALALMDHPALRRYSMAAPLSPVVRISLWNSCVG